MGRVTGAVLSMLLVSGGAMGTLTGVLGPWAEAASVAMLGVGLWTCGGLLAARERPAGTNLRVPRQAS